MELNAVQSSTAPTSSFNYETMLKESIEHFLNQYREGVSDFSGFSSIFFRLLQTMADPPLEIIWFYSAVTFHSTKLTVSDASIRVFSAKDLFQMLVSCSSSCNGLKSVAVLAPLIFVLYQLFSAFLSRSSLVEIERELSREVECLVEGIISYISICSCNNSDGQDGLVGLNSCLIDLIRVWTVNRVKENCSFEEDMSAFFPLVNAEVRKCFSGGCVVGHLAGVVMSEALLLRLCLKFYSGIPRDIQKEMRNWVVCSISGFKNFYLCDTLLRMLLEPVLPVNFLLNFEGEVLLRNILYDAVIMVDFSFLGTERVIQQLHADSLNSLAVKWLFVVDNAIRLVRENGDENKAISYVNAFSQSFLCAKLVQWANNQVGKDGSTFSPPNASTPIALIEWLMAIEGRGLRVCNPNNILKLHQQIVMQEQRILHLLPDFGPDRKNPIDNHILYIDEEGQEIDRVGDADQEMDDSLTNSVGMDGRRKRKEASTSERAEVKFVKYNFHENSERDRFFVFNNNGGMHNGIKWENPASEDMEL